MGVRVGLWRKLSAEELMLLNCGVGEDSWESLGLQGDPNSPFWRRSALGFLWKDWSVYSCHLFLISSASVRSIPFLSFIEPIFAWGDQSIRASASASVVPISSGLIPLGWTGLISCSPRDSQVSSSTPQFKNINSLAFSFLCGPTLTSIHDYCKNHSFD